MNDELEKIHEELENLKYNLYEICNKLKDLYQTDMKMPFGKYKGTEIKKLSDSYVAWLFGSGTLDRFENRDLKEALQKLFSEKDEQFKSEDLHTQPHLED